MAFGRPTVEIVIRRWLMPSPSSRLASSSAGKQRIQIRQRLAHPHHHDVAQPLVGTEQQLQPQHLLDDFARREIPRHALEAAGTEHATHAAADLRADADRASQAAVFWRVAT